MRMCKPKVNIALIVILCMSGSRAVAGSVPSEKPSQSYGTVLDVAETSFGCTTFVRLARKAGLDKMVFNGKGPFTLFAPSNDAFTPELLSMLENNSTLLNEVLRFHSTNGVIVTVKDIHKNDKLYPSCLDSAEIRANFYVEGTKVGVYTASGAFLTNGDYKADNGLVHYVINLMYPIPDTEIEKFIASNKTFSILHDLVQFAGLKTILDGSTAYTLFAPTNKAFKELSPKEFSMLQNNKTFCRLTLLRHMMNGTSYSVGVFNDQPELSSEGSYLHFKTDFETGTWTVQDIPVVEGNLSKTNGIVHIVNNVLPNENLYQKTYRPK